MEKQGTLRKIAIQKEKVEEETKKQKTGEGGVGGEAVGHQHKGPVPRLHPYTRVPPDTPSKEWEKHMRRCQIKNSEKRERRREEIG